ncbi:hypothetical protein H0H92_001574, partial [Tricholoma furcatifolium]
MARKAERSVVTSRGIKRAIPAQFSTILVQVKSREAANGPLNGLHIAQVRTIFQLPDTYSGQPKEPLLYVHWFKPLGQFDVNIG